MLSNKKISVYADDVIALDKQSKRVREKVYWLDDIENKFGLRINLENKSAETHM